MKKMTVAQVKAYETEELVKAFEIGTADAWRKYRSNVKKIVDKFNRQNAEQIDIDMLMAF